MNDAPTVESHHQYSSVPNQRKSDGTVTNDTVPSFTDDRRATTARATTTTHAHLLLDRAVSPVCIARPPALSAAHGSHPLHGRNARRASRSRTGRRARRDATAMLDGRKAGWPAGRPCKGLHPPVVRASVEENQLSLQAFVYMIISS